MLKPIRGVPIYEQETTVQFNRDSALLTIFTNDNTVITKLSKLVERNVGYRVVRATPFGYEIECPKTLISFRLPRKKPELSPEQRAKKAATMRAWRTRGNDNSDKAC